MVRDGNWLITLLKSHNVDVESTLGSLTVGNEDLIPFLHRNRVKLPESFFKDLARILNLPYLSTDQVRGKSKIALIMPYLTMKNNLVLPIEVSEDRIKIATSNPLNNKFLKLLEQLFRDKSVELYVASIEAVDGAIENGYRELHKDKALRDLIYRRPDESAYRVLYPWQRYLIIGSSIFFLVIINYPTSLIILFSTINIIYFIVNPIKFYISIRSFLGSHRVVRVSDDEVKKTGEKTLPAYIILIPSI